MQTEQLRGLYIDRGLVFRGQNNKQLVLYLLTGRYIYKTMQF